MHRYDRIMEMLRDGRTNEEIAEMYDECSADDIEVYRKVLEGRTCRLSLAEITEAQRRIRNFPVSEQDIIELYLQGMTYHDIGKKLHKSHMYVGAVVRAANAKGILNARDREKLETRLLEDKVLEIYNSGNKIKIKTIAQMLGTNERRVINVLTRRVYWPHTKARKQRIAEERNNG